MKVNTRNNGNNELKFYAASKGVRLRKEFSEEDAEKFRLFVDELANEGRRC